MLLLLLAAILGLSGCSAAQAKLLGMLNGQLFIGYDTLALPGEAVDVKVRLQGGSMLRDKPGYVVRFYDGGQLFKAAETDDDGNACVSFTSQQSGDVLLSAGFSPNGFLDEPPPPTNVLVACRPADAPMIVVDLDQTLVASGIVDVLLDKARPVPDAQRVVQRLAGQYTIIYLTGRPDLFTIRTRQWLAENGFPRAVLLMASMSDMLSGQFKPRVLGGLHERFTNLRFGIGDKASDMRAYAASGMTGVMLLNVADDASPDDLWKQMRELQALPPNTQVVQSWRQIEQVIFENQQFPADQAQRQLMDLAGQREQEQQLKSMPPQAHSQAGGQASSRSASSPAGHNAGTPPRTFRHGRHGLGQGLPASSQPASQPQ